MRSQHPHFVCYQQSKFFSVPYKRTIRRVTTWKYDYIVWSISRSTLMFIFSPIVVPLCPKLCQQRLPMTISWALSCYLILPKPYDSKAGPGLQLNSSSIFSIQAIPELSVLHRKLNLKNNNNQEVTVVVYLSSKGLTWGPRQLSVDSSKRHFIVCPYAPMRADSSGHTRNFLLQSLFKGNQRLHTHCSASLDTKWTFSLCYTPDHSWVHNTLLILRSSACGLYTTNI